MIQVRHIDRIDYDKLKYETRLKIEAEIKNKEQKQVEQDDCKNKEQEIKYSLLHLSSGIELILKSRLFREH